MKAASNEVKLYSASVSAAEQGVAFIKSKQFSSGAWYLLSEANNFNLTDKLEWLNDCISNEDIGDVVQCSSEYLWIENDTINTDVIANYITVDKLRTTGLCSQLLKCQNPDGGFGLAEGYTSDIIDTKLALKALVDCGEADAMTNDAAYIASLQNEDGGFGYQTGLGSNPLLSAEIADILIDTISVDSTLSYYLNDTFTALESYLDANSIAVSELSANDIDGVYQHFYTALFKLKKDGKYDVEPYYAFQSEDGGVFDDPYATALYLELLVREENALVAKIDGVSITNDKGYAVSSFNSDENVNIDVVSEYETDKAHLELSVITPDSTEIELDTENPVWNTADYEDGTYTICAEIIRDSTEEVAVSLEQTFSIQHRLAVDSISLELSQAYSKVGDDDAVDVSAEFDISNYNDDDNLKINWYVSDLNDTIISENTIDIAEADIAMNSIKLGSFVPDTSERSKYIIRAELMSNDLQIAQTTTNYFISDKSVALVYDVDKDYLTETDDTANVTLNIRDERVVDLIFTTASEDTGLISEYSEKIENIKERLEKLGYVVNLSNVETSYLSAQDTFAWEEYDHIYYHDRYCSDIPKHIVYDGNDIIMKGYGWAPLKDFLLVNDDKDSQKILEFDIQRDNSNDWHTLDGGGFLFNTSIEDNTLKGFCILINSNGLNLYQINGVDVNKFRNGSYRCLRDCPNTTVLKNFKVSDLKAKHHIKIVADGNTLSLWNDDEALLEEYELPENDFGNGYGPITSYQSHSCWVRSSFTFSNITMQTIAGEKLFDVLDNYNFESENSRYVICLNDSKIDGLDDEETFNSVIQKILEKNITFIGLGNDKSAEQYQQITEACSSSFYDYNDDTAINGISDLIVNAEEAKRVVDSDAVIATSLSVTGVLPDGSTFSQQYDALHEGETISLTVPVIAENLTSGIDAVLLKDIRLDYLDENNNPCVKTLEQITLPVVGYEGKITNKVSTDKEQYYQYDKVDIFDRIHNNSEVRPAKGLVNVIKIVNSSGDMLAEYSEDLAEISAKGFVERNEAWSAEDAPAGTYTVKSYVYDGDVLISQSEAEFEIAEYEQPQYELDGELSASGKLFKTDETITISKSIENVGRYDIENGTVQIKIIDTEHKKTVYEYTETVDLPIGESQSSSFSVVPADDFTSRSGKEYLITYEVITEDGQTISLPGDGFMLDGFDLSFLGDDVLFSMGDASSELNGIKMSGWKLNLTGSMHSNSNAEANCSIFTATGYCTSVSGTQFNTGQTILSNEAALTEYQEFPDILSAIQSRLSETTVSIENGWISESDSTFRIYGNSVVTDTDIYSQKSLVIDPSNFTSETEDGILICSEGDITIKSTDVNFKGVIYAPNGTVRIEANNFNIKGRVIAQNIVFQGSVFNGETYDGDLELFN